MPLCKTALLRVNEDDTPYLTDDHLFILDLHCNPISDPALFERTLRQIPGVAQVGLFCGMTSRLIIGFEDGTVEERS